MIEEIDAFKKTEKLRNSLFIEVVNLLLRGDEVLKGMVSGIYTYVPAAARYPYVFIGEHSENSGILGGLVFSNHWGSIVIYDEGVSGRRVEEIGARIEKLIWAAGGGDWIQGEDNSGDGGEGSSRGSVFCRVRMGERRTRAEQDEDGCGWISEIKLTVQSYR